MSSRQRSARVNTKERIVLFPRIPMIPTDLPFDFKRLQFPVRFTFAMTINKSQVQSLEVCGINLEFPCFAHGQLYVACSRVRKLSSLYIYAPQKRQKRYCLSESFKLINCIVTVLYLMSILYIKNIQSIYIKMDVCKYLYLYVTV